MFILAGALVGCASDEDRFKDMSEQTIFQGGQESLKQGDYHKAVDYFEAQETKYPYGPNAKREQLNIVYAYYKNEDYASAQSAAERYIHLYPGDAALDYVYYLRAMSIYANGRTVMENYFPVDAALRDRDPMQDAYNAFTTLIQRYPQSQYTDNALSHMLFIRNGVARNIVASADYYYSRGAYVAALNNAQEVVLHYQGAPAVADALVLMVHAYQQLNLIDDATRTRSIIAINYPTRLKDLNN